MDLEGDRRSVRWLAWTCAVAFFLATLIVVLLGLNLTAPQPVFREGDSVLVDNILIRLGNEQARWAQDAGSSLLFAVAFLAVAGLGATLPRLIGTEGGRRSLAGTAFMVAGAIGVVAALLYVGVKEVAISSDYCECALRDPQLISRATTLDLITNAQGWLIDGFAATFAIGLILVARLKGGVQAMPDGWRTMTLTVGIVGFGFVVAGHVLSALSSADLDLSNVSLLLVAIVAGLLTPAWAVVTARTIR